MPSYKYLHLDVFTDIPFSGNQLAVFPDATGLEAELMQRIALEMAFSETTFVFPAEASGTDVKVRIFTPHTELPMAGHPTIGTTFALAHERRIAPENPVVTLGLGIGPIPVQLEWESKRLVFAWMAQPLPEFGATLTDMKGLALALGVEKAAICDSKLPVQVVSSGVPFLFGPLTTRKAVDAVTLDRTALREVCRASHLQELPVFAFSLEIANDDATAYSRMFAPVLGIEEDPATGGASGPLGSYLVRHGAVEAAQAAHMVSLQGVKMGRTSHIHISIGARNGSISDVHVGGKAVLVGNGTIHV